MKWLFLFLLLLNIGLFVWIYPKSTEPEPVSIQTPGVKRLVLLSELDPETLEAPQVSETATTDMPVAAEQPALDSSASQVSRASEEAGSMVAQNPDQTVKEPLAELTEPALAPLPDEETYNKSEHPSLVEAGISEQQTATVNDSTADEPRAQCTNIGPFEKRDQADKLSLRLRALGFQPDLSSEVAKVQEGYWVLIPPQQDRQDALQIVKRLRKAGISDLWRFTSGSLKHAISLGLFRNESRALIRQKEIQEKGFEAEISPRYRQKTNYWLSFTLSNGNSMPEESWREIVEIHPEIERYTSECGEFAGR